MNNLRYATRQLLKHPGFAIVVVLMLALGIGTTTGTYSIYHTVLMKPLPVPEPDRLVNFSSPGPKWGMTSSGRAGRNEYVFSYPMFRDLEARQTAFAGVAGHRIFDANLSFDGNTVASAGILVSGQYFQTLGLKPALGSLIGPQHANALGESPVAVLAYDYWQNAFGGSPDVIDDTLIVNGHPLTVIGVAPESFSGTTLGLRPSVFVPLTMYESMMPNFGMGSDDRRAYWVYVFARLRDGVGAEAAAASINSVYGGILSEIEAPLNVEMPDQTMRQFLARRIVLEPGAQGQSNAPRIATTPLTLLLVVSGLVLAIVCVNVAGLLLVRSESRAGETAVRASIGASGRHLVALFLAEAGILAALGGLASLPVAVGTIDVFTSILPPEETGSIVFELDPAALFFAGAVTIATLLLFGLVPAIRASRVQPAALISAYGTKATGSRSVARFRSVLATSQIGLSMILLVLGGLFVQSLYNVASVDLGMEVDSLVSFSVSPGLNGYDNERVAGVFDRIERELGEAPGVTDVASSMVPLLTGSNWTRALMIEGVESGPGIDTESRINRVGPGFFRTMSMPLLAGRAIEPTDVAGSPRVAVVNEAFLEKFGLGRDAVGRRLGIVGTSDEPDIELVGIVPDAKYSEVKDPVPPQLYLARHQGSGYQSMNFYVRGDAAADVVMRQIVAIVERIDPNLPVNGLTTVRDVVRDNVFLDRMLTTLAGAFALIATFLAGIGLYGTLAYSVGQRTREFGIRLALGATPGGLRSDVLGQVVRLGLVGGAAGLVCAVGIGMRAETLLFGLTAASPLALTVAVLSVAVVVLAAGAIPARQAGRIAPMEALRYE